MPPVTDVMTPAELYAAKQAARILVRLRLEHNNKAENYESEVLKLHRIIDADLNALLNEVNFDQNTDRKKFELAKNEVRYLVKNYREKEDKRKKRSNNLFDLLMRLFDGSGYIYTAETKRQEAQARKASIAKQSTEARQSRIDDVFELLANYSQKLDENSALQIKAALVGTDSSDQQFSADELAAQSSKLIESVDLMKGVDTLSALTQRLYQLEQFSEEFLECGDFAAVVNVFLLIGDSLREKLNQQFSAANEADKDAACQFMLDHKVFWLDSSSLSENPEGVEEKYRNQFEINKKLKPLTVLVNFWLSGGAYAQRYASIFALLRKLMGENFNIPELRKLLPYCEAASSLSPEQADVMLNDLLLLATPEKFNQILQERAEVLARAKNQSLGNDESQELFGFELHQDLAGGLLIDNLPNELEELISMFQRICEVKVIEGEDVDSEFLALEIALRLKIKERFLKLKTGAASDQCPPTELFQFMLEHQEFLLSEQDLADLPETDLVKLYRQAYRLASYFDSDSREYIYAPEEKEALSYWSFEILQARLLQLTYLNWRGEANETENALRRRLREEFVLRFESKLGDVAEHKNLAELFRYMVKHKVDWLLPSQCVKGLKDSELADAQNAYLAHTQLRRLVDVCLDAKSSEDVLEQELALFKLNWQRESGFELTENALKSAFEMYLPLKAQAFERVYLLIREGASAFMREEERRAQILAKTIEQFDEKLSRPAARQACAALGKKYQEAKADWTDCLKSLVDFQCAHSELRCDIPVLSENLNDEAKAAYFENILGVLAVYAESENEEERQYGALEISNLIRAFPSYLLRVPSIPGVPKNLRALRDLLTKLLSLQHFIDEQQANQNFAKAELACLKNLHAQLVEQLNSAYLDSAPEIKVEILRFLSTHRQDWLAPDNIQSSEDIADAPDFTQLKLQYQNLLASKAKLTKIPALKNLVAACFSEKFTFGFLEAEVEGFKRVLGREPTTELLTELLALAEIKGEAVLPALLAAINNQDEYKANRLKELAALDAIIRKFSPDSQLLEKYSQVWQAYFQGTLSYDNALKNMGTLFAVSNLHADADIEFLKRYLTKPEHYRGFLVNILYAIEHEAQNPKAVQEALALYRKFDVTDEQLTDLIAAEPAETREQQAKLFKRLQRFEAFQVKLDRISDDDKALFGNINSKFVKQLKAKLGREFDERSVLEAYISQMPVPAMLGRKLPTQFLREKKFANSYSSLAEVQRVLATLRVVESYLREDVKTQANTYADYQKEGHWRTRKNVKSAFDILASAKEFLSGVKTFAEYEAALQTNIAGMQTHSTQILGSRPLGSNLHARLLKAAAPDVASLFTAMEQRDQSKVDKSLALFFRDFVPIGSNPECLASQCENYFNTFLRESDFGVLLKNCVTIEQYIDQHKDFAQPAQLQALQAALQQKILDALLAAPNENSLVGQVEDLYENNIRLSLLFFKGQADSCPLERLIQKFPMLEEDLREYERACDLRQNLNSLRPAKLDNSLVLARALNQLAATYEATHVKSLTDPKINDGYRMMEHVDQAVLIKLRLLFKASFEKAMTAAEFNAISADFLQKFICALSEHPYFKEHSKVELALWGHELLRDLMEFSPLMSGPFTKAAHHALMTIKADLQNLDLNPLEICSHEWLSPVTEAFLQRNLISTLFFARQLPALIRTQECQFSLDGQWDPVSDLISARDLLIAAFETNDKAELAKAKLALSTQFALRDGFAEGVFAPLVSLSDTAAYLEIAAIYATAQNPQTPIQLTEDQKTRLRAQDKKLAKIKEKHLAKASPLTGQAMLEAIKREFAAHLLVQGYDAEKIGGFFVGDDASQLGPELEKLIALIRQCEMYELVASVNYEIGLDQVRLQFLQCQRLNRSQFADDLKTVKPFAPSDLQKDLLLSQTRFQLQELSKSLELFHDPRKAVERPENLVRVEAALKRLVGYGQINLARLFVGKSQEELLDLTQKLSGFPAENTEAQEARKAVLITLAQRPEMQIPLHRRLFELMSQPNSFAAAASLLDAFNPGLSGDDLAAHLRSNAALAFTEATTQELLGFWSALCDFMPYAETQISASASRTSVFVELRGRLSEILSSRASQGDLSLVSKQAFVQAYYAKWIAGQLRGSSQTILPQALRTGFELIAKEYASLTYNDVKDQQKFIRIDENFREKPNVEPAINETKKFLATQVGFEDFFAACAQVMATLYEEFFKQGWQLDPVQAFVCVERLVSDWAIQANPGFAALVLVDDKKELVACLNSQTRRLEQQIRDFCAGKGFDISSYCDPIFVTHMNNALIQNGPVVPVSAVLDRDSESDSDSESSSAAAPSAPGSPVSAISAAGVAGHPSTVFGSTAQQSRDGVPVSPRSSDGEAESSKQQQPVEALTIAVSPGH